MISRRQQHYHSQRRDNREPHQRPVSNFYEYESVQSVMRSSQHHDEALRSNQLRNEAMRSSQHQDEVVRSNQLQSEAMRSIQHRDEAMKSTKQHRDEAMRSKQHRDEGMRSIQHQDEGMKSSQHQEESQKPNQNRNDASRASQHQRGTTIAVDNNSNNSLQRRMQLQEKRGINNKNNSKCFYCLCSIVGQFCVEILHIACVQFKFILWSSTTLCQSTSSQPQEHTIIYSMQHDKGKSIYTEVFL